MLKFGKYEVRKQIGAGSFGDVFKGFDTVIQRNVAIKTCTTAGEEARTRFCREAQISGNLQHPNIVTLYDFGIEGETAFLVQEFLTGEDLDDRIRRGEVVPLGTKLDWLEQIAEGLRYAHGKGVIHRDVKPGNVRVQRDGTAKILDFGVAKLMHEESVLTRTGMTLGTTAYVSPEQISGKELDARSDIFSYGVLAYELLTYERPFAGASGIEMLHAIVSSDPRPLADVWPECPPALAAFLGRCLEKEPDRRYQSFAEVLEELRALAQEARPDQPRPG